MSSLLTPAELKLFEDHEWKVLNVDSEKDIYAYIPDDDDGCMAHGIKYVRMALKEINDYVKRTEENGKRTSS